MNTYKENVVDALEDYLSINASDIQQFWLTGKETHWNPKVLQDHADYIYIRYLMGSENWFIPKAAEIYAEVISEQPLAGRKGAESCLLPHLTAYLLASLNILAELGTDLRSKVFQNIQLDLSKLIDMTTMLPIWPTKWSHHTWRVSHWIGGIPSILLSFAHYDEKKEITEDFVRSVLSSCDKFIINKHNGLLRAYKSEFLQKIFRFAYRLRHSPEHGDIGGLVHIHWLNHVLNRSYIANENLVAVCMEHLEHKPFLESVPYCLDFDYIQLVRTALRQYSVEVPEPVKRRMVELYDDLIKFFHSLPKDGYTLHKLPGALATLHEVALLLERSYIPEINVEPIDIIKKAYWL